MMNFEDVSVLKEKWNVLMKEDEEVLFRRQDALAFCSRRELGDWSLALDMTFRSGRWWLAMVQGLEKGYWRDDTVVIRQILEEQQQRDRDFIENALLLPADVKECAIRTLVRIRGYSSSDPLWKPSEMYVRKCLTKDGLRYMRDSPSEEAKQGILYFFSRCAGGGVRMWVDSEFEPGWTFASMKKATAARLVAVALLGVNPTLVTRRSLRYLSRVLSGLCRAEFSEFSIHSPYWCMWGKCRTKTVQLGMCPTHKKMFYDLLRKNAVCRDVSRVVEAFAF